MNKQRHIEKPPIWVVMATYNGERFLKEQLDSILAQSHKADKIIISDDNSSDNSLTVIEKYAERVNLKVSVNEINQGVVANFKYGMADVQEDVYVALSDQDDIWLPEKLQILYDRLDAIDDGLSPAMVYSDLCVVDRNGKLLNPSFWNELGQDGYRHALQTLLFGNFVTGCSILMNSAMVEYFNEMPSDVSMHDAWLALIAFSLGKVDAVSKPLVYYRKHENNVAHSESFRKETRLMRRISQIKSILFGNDEYLKPELALAEKFYKRYGAQLSREHKEVFEKFLSLKHKSFLEKKIAFRNEFRNYWKE